MLDFKKEIAEAIAKTVELNSEELYSYIEVPKELENADTISIQFLVRNKIYEYVLK